MELGKPEGRVPANLKVVSGAQDLAIEAVDLFMERMGAALGQGRRFTFVASGGNTPQPIYTALAKKKIPWGEIHIFLGDERNVPSDHPNSNFHSLWATLLSRVEIPPENIHRFFPERGDPAQVAREYESEIRSFFGLTSSRVRPRFELAFLGLGVDGHTASLFPDGKPGAEIRFTDPDRLVISPWVKHLDDYRFSLTPGAFDSAREVVFLVAGQEKASILQKIFESSGSEAYPASSIQPRSGKTTWLVDSAAAALLKSDANGFKKGENYESDGKTA